MARTRSTRVSLSRHPLANPTSSIHHVAEEFREHLHLPDIIPLYVVLATVAANMLPGQPVWTMLVGTPSSGKTQLLMAASGLTNTFVETSVEGRQTLLSGSGKKDRARNATGGLLTLIGGDGGLLLLPELTILLAEKTEVLRQVMGALRTIWDGFYSRSLGTDGGMRVMWRGHCAIIGGVTPVIDQYTAQMVELGERFLFCWMPESEGYEATKKMLGRRGDRETFTNHLRDTVTAFFEAEGLGWESRKEEDVFELSEDDTNWLTSLAHITATCRGGVNRNWRTREIETRPVKELPIRLAATYKQVFKGALRIGLTLEESRGVVNRLAMDSMPQLRRLVLRWIIEHQAHSTVSGASGAISIREAADLLRIGEKAAGMVLEDMQALRVLTQRRPKSVNTNAVARTAAKEEWGPVRWELAAELKPHLWALEEGK